MILATSCTLRASPGPMAGAPLKSPMVSVTMPNPVLAKLPEHRWVVLSSAHTSPFGEALPNAGRAPTPEDKLMRLRRLKKSARSWILTRSVIGMFLMNDRSTSPKLGAYHLFRETLPSGEPVQPGSPALGSQKAVGLIQRVPVPGTNL